MHRLLLTVLVIFASSTFAKIPSAYRPIIVEPPFSFSERVVDLTDAIAKANRESKPLYVYLGAEDCPPCREYTAFLDKNLESLKDAFDRVVIVDVRTWLKGPKLIFKAGDKRYSFEEFTAAVGDKNKILTYPFYWLLSPALQQIKQLPQGARHYLNVEKQLEILRLP